MKLTDRIKTYRAIEARRERPLIVYATSTREGLPAMMASDAVREFIDQIDAIEDGDRVDVLIHSTGGDALTAWKLMSILRERFTNVSVLVPYMAFSAATIFALGADEIVMHPHASLRPIDPQVTISMSDGSMRRFSFEDVGAFLRFLGDEVRVTEQAYVTSIIEKLFSTVDPLNVGAAKRASELSTSVGERLLLMHMLAPEDRAQARQIAENLNKSFFAHGDAVSRTRAKDLRLQLAASDREIEQLLWQAYLGLEGYMELRAPFDPLRHFMADAAGAASLRPIAPLQIPSNAPPQFVDNLWNAAFQVAVNGISAPGVEVEYTSVSGIVESVRLASEFRMRGRLSAARLPNGEIHLTSLATEASWGPVAMPPRPEAEAPAPEA